MWCANCKSDVAAEVTANNQSVRCATCGSEIHRAPILKTASKTQEARELLKRWSNEKILDPYGPVLAADLQEESVDLENAPVEISPSEKIIDTPKPTSRPDKPKLRFDNPHAVDPQPHSLPQPSTDEPDTSKTSEGTEKNTPEQNQAPQPKEAGLPRIDAAHTEMAAPHFDIPATIDPEAEAGWAAVLGQLLAYAGVATLTVGTVLILWGYFGGPERYTPTGWLVATVGQMLLFLGVVTLVSGGMEQTTMEVSRKIDSLGDQILRFEQATRDHALRGPSIPAEQFAAKMSTSDADTAKHTNSAH